MYKHFIYEQHVDNNNHPKHPNKRLQDPRNQETSEIPYTILHPSSQDDAIFHLVLNKTLILDSADTGGEGRANTVDLQGRTKSVIVSFKFGLREPSEKNNVARRE
jgi:hypothetical protein